MIGKRNSLAWRDSARKHYQHPIKSSRGMVYSQAHAWRMKTIAFLGITCAILVVYTLLFSPNFSVVTITVAQAQHIPQKDIQIVIDDFFSLQNRRLLNNKNYFIIDLEGLTLALKKKFRFTEISIKKIWPRSISIEFIDEPSFVLQARFTTDEWRIINYAGEQMKIIRPFDTNDLPVLWTDEKNLLPLSIELALLLYHDTELRTVFHIDYFTMNDNNVLRAVTKEGFYIQFNKDEPPRTQLERLQVLAKDLKKQNLLPKEYLLIPYNEKLFYQ